VGEISKLGAVSLNCPDPHELALFYSALLEKEITFESDDFSTIHWTTSGSRCSASRDSSPRRGPRVRFRPMSTSTSPSPISTLAKRPLSRPAPLWRRNSQSAIAGESSSTPWVTRFASRRSSLIDEESSEFSGTTAFGSKATFQEKLRNANLSEGSGVSTHVYRYARIDDTGALRR